MRQKDKIREEFVERVIEKLKDRDSQLRRRLMILEKEVGVMRVQRNKPHQSH